MTKPIDAPTSHLQTSISVLEAELAACESVEHALAKLFAIGILRYPPATREPLAEQLERQVACGAGLEYRIDLVPGKSLRVGCYLTPAAPAAEPLFLFEVAAHKGGLDARLLN